MAGHEPNRGTQRLSGLRWTALLGSATAIGLLLVYAAFVEPFRVQYREIEIRVPGLPEDLEGMKLLHISDLESTGRGARESQVAAYAEKAGQDMVVVTGDLVAKWSAGERRRRATKQAAELLSGFPGRLGTWFVEGHGERVSRAAPRQIRDALGGAGVRYLADQVDSIPVGDALLSIVGVGIHSVESNGVFNFYDESIAVQDGPAGESSYVNLRIPGSEDPQDYEFAGEFRFSSDSSGVGITFHNQMPRGLDRFYRLRRTPSKKEMHLSPHGTVFSEGRSSYAKVTRPGVWYGFRVRLSTEDHAIRVAARVWPAHEAEPGSWVIDCLDATSTRLQDGTIGLWTSGPGRKEFRSLHLAAGDRTFLPAPEESPENRWEAPDVPDYILAIAEQIPENAFPLVLSHSPDVFPHARQMGWPLVLAGHTQGGQIRLPFLGALTTDTALGREYAAGLFQGGDTRLFINRGIGTTRIPFRFLAPPEVVLITLRAAGGGPDAGVARTIPS